MDVALGLVRQPNGQKQDDALAFACSQLIHRFPRVRRYAAEHIYVRLLEEVDLLVDSGSDFAIDSMLEFPWDGDKTSAAQCREMAEQIADAVGITLPEVRLSGSSPNKRSAIQDDFATYSALVDGISKD